MAGGTSRHGAGVTRCAAALAAALALTTLGGCRSGPGPQDHFHRVEVAPAVARPAPPPLAGVLEVEPLAAEAVLAALPLLYRPSGGTGELVRYGYHLWTDPPARMLQRAIGSHLDASGLVERVVFPEQRVRPDYVLRGRIDRLEHHPAEQVVVIGLQLDLAAEGGALPMYSMRGTERVEAAGPSVGAAVDAYAAGLGRILDRFTAGLVASLDERGGAPSAASR